MFCRIVRLSYHNRIIHFFVFFSTWLWNIARGISGEEVQCRLLPKSHGSGKSFPGPQALRTISSVRFSFYFLNFIEDIN